MCRRHHHPQETIIGRAVRAALTALSALAQSNRRVIVTAAVVAASGLCAGPCFAAATEVTFINPSTGAATTDSNESYTATNSEMSVAQVNLFLNQGHAGDIFSGITLNSSAVTIGSETSILDSLGLAVLDTRAVTVTGGKTLQLVGVGDVATNVTGNYAMTLTNGNLVFGSSHLTSGGKVRGTLTADADSTITFEAGDWVTAAITSAGTLNMGSGTQITTSTITNSGSMSVTGGTALKAGSDGTGSVGNTGTLFVGPGSSMTLGLLNNSIGESPNQTIRNEGAITINGYVSRTSYLGGTYIDTAGASLTNNSKLTIYAGTIGTLNGSYTHGSGATTTTAYNNIFNYTPGTVSESRVPKIINFLNPATGTKTTNADAITNAAYVDVYEDVSAASIAVKPSWAENSTWTSGTLTISDVKNGSAAATAIREAFTNTFGNSVSLSFSGSTSPDMGSTHTLTQAATLTPEVANAFIDDSWGGQIAIDLTLTAPGSITIGDANSVKDSFGAKTISAGDTVTITNDKTLWLIGSSSSTQVVNADIDVLDGTLQLGSQYATSGGYLQEVNVADGSSLLVEKGSFKASGLTLAGDMTVGDATFTANVWNTTGNIHLLNKATLNLGSTSDPTNSGTLSSITSAEGAYSYLNVWKGDFTADSVALGYGGSTGSFYLNSAASFQAAHMNVLGTANTYGPLKLGSEDDPSSSSVFGHVLYTRDSGSVEFVRGSHSLFGLYLRNSSVATIDSGATVNISYLDSQNAGTTIVNHGELTIGRLDGLYGNLTNKSTGTVNAGYAGFFTLTNPSSYYENGNIDVTFVDPANGTSQTAGDASYTQQLYVTPGTVVAANTNLTEHTTWEDGGELKITDVVSGTEAASAITTVFQDAIGEGTTLSFTGASNPATFRTETKEVRSASDFTPAVANAFIDAGFGGKLAKDVTLKIDGGITIGSDTGIKDSLGVKTVGYVRTGDLTVTAGKTFQLTGENESTSLMGSGTNDLILTNGNLVLGSNYVANNGGYLAIDLVSDADSSVRVEAGTFKLAAPTSTGTAFQVDSGATLKFVRMREEASMSLTNAGTVVLTNDSSMRSYFNGSYADTADATFTNNKDLEIAPGVMTNISGKYINGAGATTRLFHADVFEIAPGAIEEEHVVVPVTFVDAATGESSSEENAAYHQVYTIEAAGVMSLKSSWRDHSEWEAGGTLKIKDLKSGTAYANAAKEVFENKFGTETTLEFTGSETPEYIPSGETERTFQSDAVFTVAAANAFIDAGLAGKIASGMTLTHAGAVTIGDAESVKDSLGVKAISAGGALTISGGKSFRLTGESAETTVSNVAISVTNGGLKLGSKWLASGGTLQNISATGSSTVGVEKGAFKAGVVVANNGLTVSEGGSLHADKLTAGQTVALTSGTLKIGSAEAAESGGTLNAVAVDSASTLAVQKGNVTASAVTADGKITLAADSALKIDALTANAPSRIENKGVLVAESGTINGSIKTNNLLKAERYEGEPASVIEVGGTMLVDTFFTTGVVRKRSDARIAVGDAAVSMYLLSHLDEAQKIVDAGGTVSEEVQAALDARNAAPLMMAAPRRLMAVRPAMLAAQQNDEGGEDDEQQGANAPVLLGATSPNNEEGEGGTAEGEGEGNQNDQNDQNVQDNQNGTENDSGAESGSTDDTGTDSAQETPAVENEEEQAEQPVMLMMTAPLTLVAQPEPQEVVKPTLNLQTPQSRLMAANFSWLAQSMQGTERRLLTDIHGAWIEIDSAQGKFDGTKHRRNGISGGVQGVGEGFALGLSASYFDGRVSGGDMDKQTWTGQSVTLSGRQSFGPVFVLGTATYASSKTKGAEGSKVKTFAASGKLGVTAELGNVTVRPFAGVRVLRGKVTGEKAKTTYQAPVGFTVTGNHKLDSGWVVNPYLEAAYVRQFGDKAFTHETDEAFVRSAFAEKNAMEGRIGLVAEKGNLGFAVSYGGTLGDKGSKAQSVSAKAVWRF